MPTESVQCVVTSPPYHGLRAYKTEPQIWGGAPDCEHEWGALPSVSKNGNTPETYAAKQASNAGAVLAVSQGDLCTRCGAWRGELGSEPTIELYVAHIVAVFREVRRVLRTDGTCWLNIGDSYAAAQGGRQAAIGELPRDDAARRAVGVPKERP